MEKIYLAMWMWLCEGKLKVKIMEYTFCGKMAILNDFLSQNIPQIDVFQAIIHILE